MVVKMTESEYKKYLGYRKKQINEQYDFNNDEWPFLKIENKKFKDLEALGYAIEFLDCRISEDDTYHSVVIFTDADGEDWKLPYKELANGSIETGEAYPM